MTTTAFGSRRVTESLRAIAHYLDDAAQIAGGVSPGSVVVPNLVPIQRDPGPRLTSVTWKLSGTDVMPVSSVSTGSLTLLVNGSHLSDVRTFKLVTGETEFPGENLQDVHDKSFTVDVDAIPAQPCFYDAWIIDTEGQTFLLPRALRVEMIEPAEPDTGLQLIAMVPNKWENGYAEVFALVFTAGGGEGAFSVTDRNGKVLDDWFVRESHQRDAQTSGDVPTISVNFTPDAPARCQWLSIFRKDMTPGKPELLELLLHLEPKDGSRASSLPFSIGAKQPEHA